MKTHIVSIDIETAGKKPGCPVLSVGLVYGVYDHATHESAIPHAPTLLRHNILEAFEECNHVSGGTFLFWLKTAAEDPRSIEQFGDEKNPLGWHTADMLGEVNRFVTKLRGHMEEGDQIAIWTNPPKFDTGILDWLYDHKGMTPPWNHWEECDFRTMNGMFKPFVKRIQPTVKHDAGEDALAQLKTIIKWYELVQVFRDTLYTGPKAEDSMSEPTVTYYGKYEWTEWAGSASNPPVYKESTVEVEFRNGQGSKGKVSDFLWHHDKPEGHALDIMKYKVVSHAPQAADTNDGDGWG